MIALGFEPRTASLEGRCSIQLSYATIIGGGHASSVTTSLSGWQDSNLRPPRPKRGAITGLRYTPNWLSKYHFAPLFLILPSKSNVSISYELVLRIYLYQSGANISSSTKQTNIILHNFRSVGMIKNDRK